MAALQPPQRQPSLRTGIHTEQTEIAHTQEETVKQLQDGFNEARARVLSFDERLQEVEKAVKEVQKLVTAALLAAGARIDSVDEGGHSALHIAASFGHAEVVEILCRALAEVRVGVDTVLVGPAGCDALVTWMGTLTYIRYI